jgi:hypothetical protein
VAGLADGDDSKEGAGGAVGGGGVGGLEVAGEGVEGVGEQVAEAVGGVVEELAAALLEVLFEAGVAGAGGDPGGSSVVYAAALAQRADVPERRGLFSGRRSGEGEFMRCPGESGHDAIP